MAGYDWNSGMSNNAVSAYENGEKPLSKWTKKAILAEVERMMEDDAVVNSLEKEYGSVACQRLRSRLQRTELPELLVFALYKTGYHHTSKYFNSTDFYAVDELSSLYWWLFLKKNADMDSSDREKKIVRRELYLSTRVISCFFAKTDDEIVPFIRDFCKNKKIDIPDYILDGRWGFLEVVRFFNNDYYNAHNFKCSAESCYDRNNVFMGWFVKFSTR